MRLEVHPRESGVGAAEEGVRSGFTGVGCGAVVEEEADGEVLGGGEAGGDVGGGEEFECHRGSVVNHASEVVADGGEVGEAEEGEESGVGAELDAEFLGAGRADDAVHVGEHFASELHAADGTHVVGGVVGKTPFVGVGKSAQLEEGVVGEDVGVGDGGVVDLGDVDDVVDCHKLA